VKQPIIMDVDTGVDDALALLYLLASPEAEILAITCTSGNVPARQVAANNLALLELCNATGIEVALGADAPLVQPLMTLEATHGPQGLGYAELPTPGSTVSSRHATTVWAETVRSRPGEVVGLVTGPLTNLALALRIEPELPLLLKRLVIMGGSFNHIGNTAPTTEWNIAVDPEAAKFVFDAFSAAPADRRPIVCGLDITEQVALLPEHIARIADIAGSMPVEAISPHDARGTRSTASNAIVRHLSDAVRFYIENQADSGEGFRAYMHDPFAAALAIHSDLAELRPATVDVELMGTLTRGTTVADYRGTWGRGLNAEIAWSTDPQVFLDRLVDRIGRFARETKGATA
jgi:purine nucleosidase